MKILALALAATVAVFAASSNVSAASQTQNIRGTIVSANATAITLKTASGPVTVKLGPKTGIAGAVAGSSADIVPGKFLGIASVSGAGVSRALEVVVFDDSMRGVGEGEYPWDLSSPRGHSSMTNGTVGADNPHSTMTNATVGAMSGSGQKTVTMRYKGGSRRIIVSADAPVVRVAPGKPALLVAGASVFVIATKTASPVAAFVVVGIDGVKPPM